MIKKQKSKYKWLDFEPKGKRQNVGILYKINFSNQLKGKTIAMKNLPTPKPCSVNITRVQL